MQKLFVDKIAELGEVFSPSAPIATNDLFFGRIEQVTKILEAITERGQHAVLYGERGVGKTSLANIIKERFKSHEVITEKINCSRTDEFSTMWRKILDKVLIDIQTQGMGFKPGGKKETIALSDFLPQKEKLTPSDVSALIGKLNIKLLLIFDEFDTVRDQRIKSEFADLIKDLSDNYPNVTILIVGIADNVNNLIGEHRSVERCLRQIPMPRMSDDELKEIIDKGLSKIGMTINPEVRENIVDLSQGFPHYTHLLTKYSAKQALLKESLNIDKPYFYNAIREAIENADATIRNAYQKAVITSKEKSKFENVVSACAIAKEDEYGAFRTKDVIDAYFKVTGDKLISQAFTYNLGKLCQEEKGALLEKVGKGKQIKYRFQNPLVKVFIKLKLYQKQN